MTSGEIGSLTSPRVVRDLLRRHGLGADHALGQHFLVDDRVLAAVVEAAGVREGDEVWEVGAGLGVLTRALAARAARVVAIELDRRLLPVLAETLEGLDHVEVRNEDALRTDFGAARPGSTFAANLPYAVGTTVLVRALESGRFRRAGVLLQREVADRLGAAPGSPAYGALSLLVAHLGRARTVRTVPPGAFLPPPEVTSAVVEVRVHEGVEPDARTFAVVRAGFAHRRKTLAKNLRLAGWDAPSVRAALADEGLDPAVRAEALSLERFRSLARRLPPPGTEVP